jgi:hypothetical protein
VRGGGDGPAVARRVSRGRARGGRLLEPDMEEAGGSDVSELETGDSRPRGGRAVGLRAAATA